MSDAHVHREAHRRGASQRSASRDVLGVHGEARREHLAGRLGRGPQPLERGPRPLGVHVVGRDGRDAAPVVDAGVEQRAEVVAQVRRRLEVHRRAPSTRRAAAIGPQELVGRARSARVHRGARLGQEVLDDHLLHVTVALVALARSPRSASSRSARVSPMPTRIPVVNGMPGPPGGLERGEPARGRLVGRAVVRAAGLAEPRRERLDHHPLRRADRAEPVERRLASSAPALAWGSSPVSSSTARGGGDEVVDGRGVPVVGEPLAAARVARPRVPRRG